MGKLDKYISELEICIDDDKIISKYVGIFRDKNLARELYNYILSEDDFYMREISVKILILSISETYPELAFKCIKYCLFSDLKILGLSLFPNLYPKHRIGLRGRLKELSSYKYNYIIRGSSQTLVHYFGVFN